MIYEDVVEIQKLVAPDGAAGSLFGSSTAIDGGILVVGAHHHNAKGILVCAASLLSCA